MYLEVRPAEGGQDAVDFADEIFRSLLKYAKSRGADPTIVRSTDRNLVADIGVSEALNPFVGTHRIQRVPKNDRRGRRHTSTVTIAIVGGVDSLVILDENEVELITYKGSGPGGQHRNKTETAVLLRHLPTGIEVRCEDSRSQWNNKESAYAELRRRLEEAAVAQARGAQQDSRRSQIRSGERPVKEFTHNEQRNETVDHASGRRWRMDHFLKGRI